MAYDKAREVFRYERDPTGLCTESTAKPCYIQRHAPLGRKSPVGEKPCAPKTLARYLAQLGQIVRPTAPQSRGPSRMTGDRSLQLDANVT